MKTIIQCIGISLLAFVFLAWKRSPGLDKALAKGYWYSDYSIGGLSKGDTLSLVSSGWRKRDIKFKPNGIYKGWERNMISCERPSWSERVFSRRNWETQGTWKLTDEETLTVNTGIEGGLLTLRLLSRSEDRIDLIVTALGNNEYWEDD